MSKEQRRDYIQLLSAISSEIAIKILNLYAKKDTGLNLTTTADLINENTSTVRDYLNRFLESNLIYREQNDYYLSNFGSLVRDEIKILKNFYRIKTILGQIPANQIPIKYLKHLQEPLKKIKVQSGQWQFMALSSKLLNKMQQDLLKGKINLKICGWRSLTISMNIIRDYLNSFSKDVNSLQQFLEQTSFQLITDSRILEELKVNEEIKEILKKTDLGERINIVKHIEEFKFTLFRYDTIIQFFLNQDGKMGFNDVFEFYLNDSILIKNFLNKEE
ncbi:MAG: hypothetical protein P8Y70_02580 [Candidatus Lokiarchaeota archaeon]